MKLVILADPLDNQNAGIHVYTREMINALVRKNREHEIIVIRENYDPALKGVKQVTLPNTRLPIGFASLRLFFLIPVIVRWLKADVVIEPAHFGPFNMPKTIKRVTIIHDLTPILFPRLHRWHSQMLQKIFLSGILKKADRIITNSDYTFNDVCKYYPVTCDKMVRIYPGVSAELEHSASGNKLDSFGIHKPFFLNVGTIEPRKNLVELLKSFQLFCEENGEKMQLVITGGEGWKYEDFRSALNTFPFREQVILTGYVPDEDLSVLYRNCVAMVYPSLYEGFGLPVVEAMSCGAAVITSRVSSLPEAGGSAALYYLPGDASELASLMKEVAHNEELRQSLKARSVDHSKTFSWDYFGEQLWDALDKV